MAGDARPAAASLSGRARNPQQSGRSSCICRAVRPTRRGCFYGIVARAGKKWVACRADRARSRCTEWNLGAAAGFGGEGRRPFRLHVHNSGIVATLPAGQRSGGKTTDVASLHVTLGTIARRALLQFPRTRLIQGQVQSGALGAHLRDLRRETLSAACSLRDCRCFQRRKSDQARCCRSVESDS